MTVNLLSPRITQSFRNQRDALTVADADLIVADLNALNTTGAGDVSGPVSSVDDNIALFDGITGKIIKDSGVNLADILNEVFYGALQVDAATTAVLAGTPVYDNGVSGVGATLTKGSNGAFPTIDGVTAIVGKRYLIKNQAAQLENGVYELTTLGTAGTPWVLTRTTDSDLNTELDAQIVIPGGGTVNKRFVFNQQTALPVIGTSNIVYAQTSAAAGIGAPLSRTVAQMQTLVGASGIIPGRAYLITNVQVANCTCSALFIGLTTTTISSTGWGTFLNAAMSAAVPVKIEYILGIDKIVSVYAYETDVLVTSWYNVTGITSWPFDSTTIKAGQVHDPVTLSVSPTSIMTYFNFKGYPTITTATGTTFQGEVGIEATVTLGGTSTWVGKIGDNSGLTMSGTQSLTWCELGNNKQADFSNLANTSYTRVGKTYTGNFSDFDVDNLDVSGDQLDMSINTGTVDMANFLWAGILKISGDATQKLNYFANPPIDHSWTVIPYSSSPIVMINSVPNGGTNIYLETNTFITLQALANPVDRAVFQADEQDNTLVVKIGGANYVI